MRIRALIVAATLLPWPSPAAQGPSFRSGVDLVEVAVIVRDGDGRFVADLTKDDFHIVEQGTAQAISAFDRVLMPVARDRADAAPDAAVRRDVSTNEQVGDARIFVIVLDAFHVDQRRTQAVRKQARRFVERYVGPTDLAAVISPGGLESATQDFTNDKARLLAAIDRFAGHKIRSATVEIAEEARQGFDLHQGKDPSDHERSGRARALTTVLQALARHLDRIEQRRKTLLLFSEGVDYNQMDVLATTQRYSSDVMRAMNEAVGALMRTNVSLYAIDPRGLASAEGDLGESNAYGVARGIATLSNSADQEYTDSIKSLRDLSESTGGFAAVDSNAVDPAFERIVEDSSRYYVLGYTPSKPARPGEFRQIDVRVSRPGLRVIARKGYLMAPAAVRVARNDAGATSPFGSPAVVNRGPGMRPGQAAPPELAPAPMTTRLAGDLQMLLASPLPRAGLPMRVQAIPSIGNGGKNVVQLVIEVLGGTLQFGERGGRFEERIDLALLTVDARARAENGRSTVIELRLTPDELDRVRATGVRWLSRLELAPGQYQLRVAARAARSGTTGLVTHDVEVPPADPQRLSLSGIALTSMTSVLMITRGDAKARSTIDTPLSAARTFVAGDRLTAVTDVYVPAAHAADIDVVAEVEWADRSRTPLLKKTIPGASRSSRTEQVVVPVDTSTLPPGRYVLRIALIPGGRMTDGIDRQLPFDVTTPSRR